MAERLRIQETLLRQNATLRQERDVARTVQLGLLPSRPPWSTETLATAARSLSASEVGGDFYLYGRLADNQLLAVIGDVSGKGVGAALMMALTTSAIESEARTAATPAALLASLAERLSEQLAACEMFVSVLALAYNPQQRTLAVASAGMPPPIVLRDDSARASRPACRSVWLEPATSCRLSWSCIRAIRCWPWLSREDRIGLGGAGCVAGLKHCDQRLAAGYGPDNVIVSERIAMRLLLRWLITAVALAVAVYLVPGIEVTNQSGWIAVLVMAVALGLVNAIVRPLLSFLTCGFIVLTLGLFIFVINALCFQLAAWLANQFGAGFVVDSFWSAFLASIVVSVVSFVLSIFLPDDERSASRA